MSSSTRELLLGRIRAALKDYEPQSAAAAWEEMPRNYDRSSRLSLAAKLDLLEDRLRDYDAHITRAREDEVPSAIRSILAARGNLPTLYPTGFPMHWLPEDAPLTLDENFPPQQLDCFDGVLTGCSVAIAETGSLVLQSVPGQGRRSATLVPDFHLCVVLSRDVVENVPEAFERLAPTAALPTTFISGPSATADIEMTRIKGVHGPRFLHVLLVT